MYNHKQFVAVLIDGGFFLKRYRYIIDPAGDHSPEKVAKSLYTLAHKHVGKDTHLYRIFYYDCLPFDKKVHNPVTNKVLDFKKTTQYEFRIQFFEELKKK